MNLIKFYWIITSIFMKPSMHTWMDQMTSLVICQSYPQEEFLFGFKKKNLLPRWDSNRSSEKSKEPGNSGPVFGVPLGQTVDIPSSRKRSTCGGGLPTIHTSTGVPENIPGSQVHMRREEVLSDFSNTTTVKIGLFESAKKMKSGKLTRKETTCFKNVLSLFQAVHDCCNLLS